jgi:DNA modification methylase
MNDLPRKQPFQGAFDYTQLHPENRLLIQQHTQELKERLQKTAQDIWEIGQKLAEVRSKLKHGQFDNWLKAEFGWSRRTAYNFINVYETFSERAKFAHFNIATSALYLLASPSIPQDIKDQFIEVAQTGQKVTHKDIRKALDHRNKPQLNSVPQEETVKIVAQPQVVSIMRPEVVPEAKKLKDATASRQQSYWYLLARKHLLFCGDTRSPQFVKRLPPSIPLALGLTDGEWQHDWLLDKASAVLILQLAAVDVQLVQRLVMMFSQPGESIVFPILPSGEIIVAIHNLQRLVYTGDSNNAAIQQVIAESGLKAEKVNIL